MRIMNKGKRHSFWRHSGNIKTLLRRQLHYLSRYCVGKGHDEGAVPNTDSTVNEVRPEAWYRLSTEFWCMDKNSRCWMTAKVRRVECIRAGGNVVGAMSNDSVMQSRWRVLKGTSSILVVRLPVPL